MGLWRDRQSGRQDPTTTVPSIADECEAFLAGAYAELQVQHGLPVPGWAWLNLPTHGSPPLVMALAHGAVTGPMGGPADWRETRVLVARHLVETSDNNPSEILRRQREVLMPLELVLWTGAAGVLTTRRLLELTRLALESDDGGEPDERD